MHFGGNCLGADINLKLIANLGVGGVCRAGREFNNAFRATIKTTRTPGAQGVIDADDTILFVEVDYVNGNRHKHTVDAATGVDEQPVALMEFFSANQSDEASPEIVGNSARGDEVGLRP